VLPFYFRDLTETPKYLTDCANVQAGPTMAVAEKAADLILEDFGSAQ
jgi:hypothetical protein